ncbi:hypothetical protein HAX54_038318 [Datura stramonium]|uniref:C2H2-type domain-containing protein n=1 Tax=Datura stramonium TaxID=4076 RepID=A0ABS8VNK8_DATST|nr:hypothetical protein [Datura stramonium]
MSTHPSLLDCPLCHQIVRGYQEFMIHVQSHPIDEENEMYDAEGSSKLSVPLPESSESVQHARNMRNKRARTQSPPPPPPPSFRPRWVRGNDCDKIVHLNQQLPPSPPPPPSSYRACSIGHNWDGRGVHTNQHIQAPSPYRPASPGGNDSGGGVHANQRQQMLQSTRTYVRGSNSIPINLNEMTSEFATPHIKEIDFPILDRSDPSQMSTHPSVLDCPLCHQIVHNYEELMIRVQSHPIDDENEIYDAEGLSKLSVPLHKSSESVQHAKTMRNKRARTQSPPPSFRPRWVRGNDCDKIVHLNQQLSPSPPPPPPSYHACSIAHNWDGRGVHTNQHIQAPSPYRLASLGGNDSGGGVHANQRQQMLQSTRTYVRGSNSIPINLNEMTSEFATPHIKEIDFPILDKSDPSQLKFKPPIVREDETSGMDLTLRL